MKSIETVIILAAGTGSRFKDLSPQTPKCLMPIHGKPLIESVLSCMSSYGIKKTVIVVGFQKERIKARLGNRYGNMEILYLHNRNFADTNNFYSLWIARDFFDKGFLLLEGDVLFEPDVLKRVLSCPPADSTWVVYGPLERPMAGGVVNIDKSGRIEKMFIHAESPVTVEPSTFKLTGVVKIHDECGRKLKGWMKEDLSPVSVKSYYHYSFMKRLDMIKMNIVNIENLKCYSFNSLEEYFFMEKCFNGTT